MARAVHSVDRMYANNKPAHICASTLYTGQGKRDYDKGVQIGSSAFTTNWNFLQQDCGKLDRLVNIMDVSSPYKPYCKQLGYINAVYSAYAKAQDKCFQDCQGSGTCACVRVFVVCLSARDHVRSAPRVQVQKLRTPHARTRRGLLTFSLSLQYQTLALHLHWGTMDSIRRESHIYAHTSANACMHRALLIRIRHHMNPFLSFPALV